MHRLNSTAVMQRRVEPQDSRDDFPTPPWGTRALFQYVVGAYTDRYLDTVWEPTCNRGYMVRVLQEWFRPCNVHYSDAFEYNDRRCVYRTFDYATAMTLRRFDWVVMNPPFRLIEEFILRALSHTNKGVAILGRIALLEGMSRYDKIFTVRPPTFVAPFVERLPMVRGRVDEEIASATAYAWFVWAHADPGPTRVVWIPPCRGDLERPGDYPTRIPLTWRRRGIMV
jgi:hypothetical protein